jgi:hypothetical protein
MSLHAWRTADRGHDSEVDAWTGRGALANDLHQRAKLRLSQLDDGEQNAVRQFHCQCHRRSPHVRACPAQQRRLTCCCTTIMAPLSVPRLQFLPCDSGGSDCMCGARVMGRYCRVSARLVEAGRGV